jgi:hypothetical protein
MYNLLLSAGGTVRIIGYVLPIAAALTGYALTRLLRAGKSADN